VKGKKTVERTEEKTEWWYIWEPSQPQIWRLGQELAFFLLNLPSYVHYQYSSIRNPSQQWRWSKGRREKGCHDNVSPKYTVCPQTKLLGSHVLCIIRPIVDVSINEVSRPQEHDFGTAVPLCAALGGAITV
jgi:hypothetical protein